MELNEDNKASASASAEATPGSTRAQTRTQKIGLLRGLSDGTERATLRAGRHGRLRRLFQIAKIASKFDILHGVTPINMRLMFEALGPTLCRMKRLSAP